MNGLTHPSSCARRRPAPALAAVAAAVLAALSVGATLDAVVGAEISGAVAAAAVWPEHSAMGAAIARQTRVRGTRPPPVITSAGEAVVDASEEDDPDAEMPVAELEEDADIEPTPGPELYPLAGVPFDQPRVRGLGKTTPVRFPGAKGSPKNGYHMYGASYSPFGLGDNRLCPPFDDLGGMCLLPSQVRLDMSALSKVTKRVKTYSSVCTSATREILESARRLGMTVMYGVWIENDVQKNIDEFKRAVYFIGEFEDVVTHVMVGNEPVFIIGMAAEFVAQSVVYFRSLMSEAGLSIPIGVADIYNMWMNIPVSGDEEKNTDGSTDRDMTPVVAAVDWIGLNTHTYWHGLDPTTRETGAHVVQGAKNIEATLGKPCIITETGYPTRGDPHRAAGGIARPSESRQSIFLYDVEMAARAADQPVYLFEPFDGDWKRRWAPYIEMDYSFGFSFCNRTMKDIRMPPLGAR